MVRSEVKVYYPSNWFYLIVLFGLLMSILFILVGVTSYRTADQTSDKIILIFLVVFGVFLAASALVGFWQMVQKNRWIEVYHDRLEVKQPLFFYMKHYVWKWDEIAAIDIMGQAGFMVLHKPPIKKKIMLKGYPRELMFEIVRRTPGIKIHFDVYKKIRKLAEAEGYPFTEESFL